MSLLHRKPSIDQSIKEAVDSLPAGICFYREDGLMVLCNRQMAYLMHAISGNLFQLQSEMEYWLEKPPAKSSVTKTDDVYVFQDGSAWHFEKHRIADQFGMHYTEYIASDVSELNRKNLELQVMIREQREVLSRLDNISQNIAIITRNEEALKMKMKMHNDLGAALNFARLYLADGCPKEEKDAFVAKQREMSMILLGESQNEEDNDPLKDLYDVANALDIRIVMTGEENMNPELRRLLSYAVRECLTNTIRHADGDTVYVEILLSGDTVLACLTNNGKPPKGEIREGGGLSSLREKMTRCGCSMEIFSQPRFVMKLVIPKDARDD